MATLLTYSDSCILLADQQGFGMPTVWVMNGQSDVYSGNLVATDGY